MVAQAHPPVIDRAGREVLDQLVEGSAGRAGIEPGRALLQAGAVKKRAELLDLPFQLDQAAAKGRVAQQGQAEGIGGRQAQVGNRHAIIRAALLGRDGQPAAAPTAGGDRWIAIVDIDAAQAAVIVVRSDDDIGIAVAVHIARGADTVAHPGRRLVALGHPVGIGRGAVGPQAGRRAVVGKDGALLRLAAFVMMGGDQKVGIAVAIDVAGRGHRRAHIGTNLVALGKPVGVGRGAVGPQAGRRAIVDKGAAVVGLAAVVRIGTDDNVGIAVAVHVAGGVHRGHGSTDLIALEHPVGIGRGAVGPQAGRRAIPDKGGALVGLAVVVIKGRDDDVGIAVAVHVAGGADPVAQDGGGLVALGQPVGVGGGAVGSQPGRRAIPDKGRTLVGLGVVVTVGADDNVGIAVAVDIAGRARRAAHVDGVLVALGRPVGGRR